MKKKIIFIVLIAVLIMSGAYFYFSSENNQWKSYYENGKETTLVYPSGWHVINVGLYETSSKSVGKTFTAFMPPKHTAVDRDSIIFVNSDIKDCASIPQATKCVKIATDKDTSHGPVVYTYSNDQAVLGMFDTIRLKNTPNIQFN